jgi:outer membrane immunogenic protein
LILLYFFWLSPGGIEYAGLWLAEDWCSGCDRSDLNGILGGGQNQVWGLEADIQGAGECGSRDFICPTGVCTPPVGGFLVLAIPGPAVPVSLDQKLEWFGTVRGRAGVLVTPKVLLYATGGLAYGEVKPNELIGALTGVSNSDTRVGYTVGAGIEA